MTDARDPAADAPAKVRLDKWLWHARFFKTRSLATKAITGGGCRINGTPVGKPAHAVAPGDVLTFRQAHEIRVVRVLAPGQRRGPASEARLLYDDLDPPGAREKAPPAPRYDGGGRPGKRERRQLEKTRFDALE